jgi:alkanesulfonate monooxygenase SsuD/methylene tetrahydromethanopterin reductase-like flavin-dependent oxidoreductase (luciferase family)
VPLGPGRFFSEHGRAAGVPYQERGRRTDEALRVLPALVAGQAAQLGDGLEVTLAPGSVMPPVLVAGNGDKALRRAAAYGDGWVCVGLSPDEVAAGLAVLDRLAGQLGRPVPRASVVGPTLDDDPRKAAAQLSEYAAAGTQRVILAPSGAGWQHDYEFAGRLHAAL